MFLGMMEAGPNEMWQCLKCGRVYAEYVNGCPSGVGTDGEQCGGPVRIVGIDVASEAMEEK